MSKRYGSKLSKATREWIKAGRPAERECTDHEATVCRCGSRLHSEAEIASHARIRALYPSVCRPAEIPTPARLRTGLQYRPVQAAPRVGRPVTDPARLRTGLQH